MLISNKIIYNKHIVELNGFNVMKHKFFIKGLVVNKNDINFTPLEGHAILELKENEVETKFINVAFITEVLYQSGLHQYDSHDVKYHFIAKLDIVNKL